MTSKKRNSLYPLFALCMLLLMNELNAQSAEEKIVEYMVKMQEQVRKGEPFNIEVILTIKPDWYIYAPTGVNAAMGMIETSVVFKLPMGFVRVGRINLPEPIRKNGNEVYEGNNVTIRQSLQASHSVQPGKYEIKSRITWQTCNSRICLQPVTEEVVAHIQIN
jgi:hypothetical protein